MFYQKPLLGQQIDWSHPLSKSLVGCWIMNEGSGDRISDLSGNGNDGTAYIGGESFWRPGKLHFDGSTNDRIAIDNVISISNQWTVSMRCAKVSHNNNGMIMGNEGSDNRYIFLYGGSDKLNVKLDGDLCSFTGITDYTQLRTYTIVQKGISNRDLYLDGVFYQNNAVTTTNPLIINTIGNGYLNTTFSYGGDIYYIYIHNRALTPQEITQLYIDPYCMFMPIFDPVLFGYASAAAGGLSIPNPLHRPLAGPLGGPL